MIEAERRQGPLESRGLDHVFSATVIIGRKQNPRAFQRDLQILESSPKSAHEGARGLERAVVMTVC